MAHFLQFFLAIFGFIFIFGFGDLFVSNAVTAFATLQYFLDISCILLDFFGLVGTGFQGFLLLECMIMF